MANDTVFQDPAAAENSLLRARISELERAVEALTRRERLLQATLDAVPDYIYVRDIDSKYVVVNSMFTNYLATTREELIGKRDTDLFPAEVIEGFRVHDRAVLSTGQPIDEEEIAPRDGALWSCRSIKFPITDEGGKIIAIGGITIDITARKRMESDLLESRTLLRGIIDATPSIIFAKDTQGRYVLVNQPAGRYMRLSPEDILGKTAYDFFPKETADAMTARDRRALEAGERIDTTEYIQHVTGRRVYLCSTFPLRNADGTIYALCGIRTDITEREEQEAERARLQQEIIRVQESALRELSTPLIPLADNVVVMPLIGSIDTARAEQALETLLRGASQHRAEVVILDITGVTTMNAQVADALVRAARAVQLLGARTVLTGIRPEVAQTLVSMGSDLSGIVTRSTLQSGIAYALERRRDRRDPWG